MLTSVFTECGRAAPSCPPRGTLGLVLWDLSFTQAASLPWRHWLSLTSVPQSPNRGATENHRTEHSQCGAAVPPRPLVGTEGSVPSASQYMLPGTTLGQRIGKQDSSLVTRGSQAVGRTEVQTSSHSLHGFNRCKLNLSLCTRN